MNAAIDQAKTTSRGRHQTPAGPLPATPTPDPDGPGNGSGRIGSRRCRSSRRHGFRPPLNGPPLAPYRSRCRPHLVPQQVDQRRSSRHCVTGSGKHRESAVALTLRSHQHAVPLVHDPLDHGIVASHRRPHLRRSVLPQRGRTTHIGEQKRHHPAWQTGRPAHQARIRATQPHHRNDEPYRIRQLRHPLRAAGSRPRGPACGGPAGSRCRISAHSPSRVRTVRFPSSSTPASDMSVLEAAQLADDHSEKHRSALLDYVSATNVMCISPITTPRDVSRGRALRPLPGAPYHSPSAGVRRATKCRIMGGASRIAQIARSGVSTGLRVPRPNIPAAGTRERRMPARTAPVCVLHELGDSRGTCAHARLVAQMMTVSPGQSWNRPAGETSTSNARSSATNASRRSPKRSGAAKDMDR